MASRFERDTAVTPIDATTFAATIDEGWWIQRGPNGGYVAAVMLRAATAVVDEPARRPRSLSIHYLRPPAVGAVTLDATVARAGRSVSTVTVTLRQDGQTMALALVALATSRPGDVSFVDLTPPPVPPPEEVTPAVERPPIRIADRYELRPTWGGIPFRASGQSEVGGWIRLTEPAPLDEHVVAAFTDAWPPAVFSRMASFAAVPTIDLTVHFRNEIPSVADDAYCLVRFQTQVASEGFLEEDGVVWAPDGTVLAQSRQLATIIPAEAPVAAN